jgi:magnesium chelatase accessory protein
MNWKKDGSDWSLNQISRFCYVRPHTWHIQDTQGTNKPSILLLHGTGASTHSWMHLIPMLESTFRVVAIDLPGHGFTTTKDHTRSSLNLMAKDILALLSAEKIFPKLIVGHSAGAALAFRIALDDKNTSAGVVAINGVLDHYFEGLSGFFYPIAAKALAINPLSALFISKLNKITRQTKRLSKMTGSKIDAQSLKFYNKLLSDPSHLAGTLAMMSQWKLENLNNDLHKLKQKSLFLIGQNDQMVTQQSLFKYAEKVKGSEIKSEEGLGHLMHEEAPAKIQKHIIKFLMTLGISQN